ncbi:MAG: hypothetical protein ABR576_10095 [Thermoanaerobaculia bacterium]
MTRRLWLSALLLSVWSGSSLARAQTGVRVDNWTVPQLGSKAVDITRPVTFVGMVPCRIADTRGPAGPYGGPILAANTQRDFDLDSGPCSQIPAGVDAYSLNFTATQTQGFGDLRVWPAGNAPPLVSTLNYVPNETVANAAIVPAGTNGAISVVAAVSGTHLIIDINGYFTDTPNVENWVDFRVQTAGGGAFEVRNLETAAAGSTGLIGITSSTGAGSYGVIGQNSNGPTNDNGGVRGRGGPFFTMPGYGQAGVRGENRDSFGVIGVTQGDTSLAVAGSNVNAGGAEEAWGGLACSNATAVCGGGNLSISGSKSFVEPHPTDASRVIKYVALEGPEAGTYFGGRSKFDRGIARISVPESFRMVTADEGLRVQVTPIGEMASVAVVKVGLDEIVVRGSRNVEFFYTVNGLRRGYEDFTPVVEEGFFMPRTAESRMPGALSAEAKRKLIANGTYNADGTVNLETAKRLGWTEKWKEASVPNDEEARRKR